MSVVSTALAINPAFLQEIKDSNPDLWETVRQVRETCRSEEEPVKVLRRLRRLLDDFRDQLALQFSLEESYGYMSVPSAASEVLCELAMRTQAQHGTLYLRVSELAEQAEELQYRGIELPQLQRLLEQTLEFDAELREHEQSEAELIDRSFGLR